MLPGKKRVRAMGARFSRVIIIAHVGRIIRLAAIVSHSTASSGVRIHGLSD